jgi:hypothetical protein
VSFPDRVTNEELQHNFDPERCRCSFCRFGFPFAALVLINVSDKRTVAFMAGEPSSSSSVWLTVEDYNRDWGIE